MTPEAIVRRARELGLDIIAICDHNSAANVGALQAASRAAGGPVVIAGLEVTTAEEVHVLGLFPTAAAARELGRALEERLPRIAWDDPNAGLCLDDDGEPLHGEQPLLIGSTGLPLDVAVAWIHERGGLAVAAHIDRPSFSVISQLGFLPPEVPFDALEISAAGWVRGRAAAHTGHGLPLLSSSDSHSTDELGAGTTVLEMEEPTLEEIALALAGARGRRIHHA